MILRLPMRGDLGVIVREAMRPHAVLCQQQRQRQHDTEQGNEDALHDGAQYNGQRTANPPCRTAAKRSVQSNA